MAEKIKWEVYEGVTNAYLDNDWEIEISARTNYNRWGEVDDNTRQWRITDDKNQLIASGEVWGLRAAKAAAIAALTN